MKLRTATYPPRPAPVPTLGLRSPLRTETPARSSHGALPSFFPYFLPLFFLPSLPGFLSRKARGSAQTDTEETSRRPHLEGVVEVRIGEGVAVEVRHGGGRRALRCPGGGSARAAAPRQCPAQVCPLHVCPPHVCPPQVRSQPLSQARGPGRARPAAPTSTDRPKWPPRK